MPSSFSQHLKTNYSPSDIELLEIRTIISSRQLVLKEIDHQVQHLELQLRTLRAGRDAEREFIEDHFALLSPIRRVPDDVLAFILLTAAEPDQGGDEPNQSRMALVPFRISSAMKFSHVCKHWRALSIGTKPLWRNIDIHIPSYPSCCPSFLLPRIPWANVRSDWKTQLRKLESMARTCIARSAGYPLCIKVIDDCHRCLFPESSAAPHRDDIAEDLRDLEGLVDLLLESAVQWKGALFSITIPFVDTPLRRLLLIQPTDNSILQNVELNIRVFPLRSGPGMPQNPLEPWQTDWMQGKPSILMHDSIRALDLNRVTQDITKMAMNWTSLTHLAFEGCDRTVAPSAHFGASEAFKLLSLCSNLITCRIPLDLDPPFFASESITLPFLEELSLTPYSHNIPIGFASHLVLPSLRKLEIEQGLDYECIPHEYEQSGVAQFFQYFGNQLIDAKLYIPVLTPTALHRSLRHLPNVIRLELHSDWSSYSERNHATLSVEMMTLLTPRYDLSSSNGHAVESPILPSMEVFACSPGYNELDVDALVDFVAARRTDGWESRVARLRKVRFTPFLHSLSRDPLELLRGKAVNLDEFSLENWEVSGRSVDHGWNGAFY
ncbi:hypothetical protein H1R20_g16197, partial [Candolleomyces eurysporus]